MQNLIPSNERLNRESVDAMLNEGNLRELLIEKATLATRLKKVEDILKEKKGLLSEVMIEFGVSEMDLGEGFYIRNVQPSTRRKVMSAKNIASKFPHLVDDLISLVEVGGYVQVKSIKSP